MPIIKRMKLTLILLILIVEMDASLNYLVKNSKNIDEEEYTLDDIHATKNFKHNNNIGKPSLRLPEILASEHGIKYDPNNKSNKSSKFNPFNLNTEEFETKQKLNNLLAYSIASRAEELSLINHPEKEHDFKHLIVEKPKHEKILGTYGSKACSLTSLAVSASNGINSMLDNTPDVKICPWHYEFSYRPDR